MKLASRRALIGAIGLVTAVAPVVVLVPAASAQGYTFTKVADSVEDGFDPFSFGCSTINARGTIAFRAGRPAPDGFNTIPGIFRANAADGTITTIAENERFTTIGFNPSMNDSGEVSFAARIDGGVNPDTESILRGNGRRLTNIASTADQFNFFGFDTSINNRGEVAFKAELDEELGFAEGLFSGNGRVLATHYLNTDSVTLDGQRAAFSGTDSRPAINNLGEIAFDESIRPAFDRGIFAGRSGTFRTIAAPDPDVFVGVPSFNDAGTAAFERSFFDEATSEFVTEIVTSDGTTVTTVADTRGPFSFFGFRPPSIDNDGDVAFLAFLDADSSSAIFTGPDPVADRVIGTGDTLDGATITSLSFCEEGLNDAGQLAFIAFFQDPNTFETRVSVYRATPA